MNWLPVVVGVLGSGGLLGSVYALLKLRPEAGQITVNAAQGAVIVQTGVIDSLQRENTRLQERIADLEAHMRDLRQMQTRVSALETENRYLTVENAGLKDRVRHLEADIAGLRGPVTDDAGDMIERREGG